MDTAELISTGLAAFKGRHAGETVIVCGCGPSLLQLKQPERFVTIGVNDVGRLFDPSYLVVVNPPRQFTAERFRHVASSKARALFTQLDLGRVHAPVVRIQLGRNGGTDCSGDVLHYTQNSPYVAVCLAAYMGASRIGLIGVDFTDDHFFGRTGRHPLSGRLAQIDREYGALAGALRGRGVELVNLSPASLLQSLPRAGFDDLMPRPVSVRLHDRPALPEPKVAAAARVFVVNYRFLSCGEVFSDGLRHAAASLKLAQAEAWWDDPRLPEKIAAFGPDLLLVVHGRRFVQKWGAQRFLAHTRSAVWLTDEPYEVDDTAAWSQAFDCVFSNDPNTLDRHRPKAARAHYLPVCFDPLVHRRPDAAERPYRVGFIGGYNAQRERFLMHLADAGLLSYVVGGPWRSPVLRQHCLAANVPASRCAELYRQTDIVINVFREQHHFNARHVPAHSMNPRIYEALACGAMVVSERRAEVGEVFPELPQFDTAEELLAIVRQLLDDAPARAALQGRCAERLRGHAYADRLQRVLSLALGGPSAAEPAVAADSVTPAVVRPIPPVPIPPPAQQAKAPPTLAAGSAIVAPLPPATRRNLLFHIWPVRGGTWRWNLDQLTRRIDLFNGRRIVGIVCDERSEPAEAVQEALAGHGCEFVVLPNDAHGEVATFSRMLPQVASTDADEVTFYAHAKGVKYEPQFPPAVRRWAEVQYAVMLDDWPALREQLQRFAMTGIFRKHGRFRNHQNVGDWHYSGTFFWMRHARVFSKPCLEVPRFYGGVEAWPGMHFSSDETGCLLLDHLKELPYQERFWAALGNAAFSQWHRQLRPVAVPEDLARPSAFESHAAPRLEHKPAEFEWWLAQLLQAEVKSLLLVDAGWGGEEWHIARRFREAGRTIRITTLCTGDRPERLAAVADAGLRFDQPLDTVTGQADTPSIQERLQEGGPIDAVFIDGHHGYRQCRADFELAQDLGPRLVGLHDIVDSDWHAQNRCCVSRLWSELKSRYQTEERAGADWAGIGLVRGDQRLR